MRRVKSEENVADVGLVNMTEKLLSANCKMWRRVGLSVRST